MTLDPDCARVHELYKMARRPPLEQQTPEQARDGMARSRPILQPDPRPVGSIEEAAADGPAGKIPLRIYRPSTQPKGAVLPAFIYFHGGGWVIGDLDSHDALCRELCEQSGVAVASVHYRLAPEHRFPAAVDDAIAATRWIAANAASLNFDADRLAVGGDSAGGNLAAVVCLMARDAGGPQLRFQLLIYPAVDGTLAHDSYRTRGDVLPLTNAAITWFRDHYLGADKSASTDWRLSPLLAKRHDGLPPAFVLTAGYDVLCDEGLAYAQKLATAGVPVRTSHMPGMIHGFITMGRIVKAANRAVEDCAAELRRAVG